VTVGVTDLRRNVLQQTLLGVTAGFAIVWSIVRASVASVTLDETDTYFWFIDNSEVLNPYPNNHVLNTVLIWISTHLFGLSSFTLRLPALVGAVVYIFACYLLSRGMTNRFSIQFPLFVCLIYNPFILDYMALARGYSLASAFLLIAIAVPVWRHSHDFPSLERSCVAASLAIGLSISANFPFAFVDLMTLAAIMLWAIARRDSESIVRIIAWCTVPGFIAVVLICGYPLAHWKKDYLFYGAHSLREMGMSLVEATLYHMNPRFGGSLYKVMRLVHPLLLPALGILVAGKFAASKLGPKAGSRWQERLGDALAAVIGVSVLVYWLAFRIADVPLPLSRTGIFLLPLCTLLAGAIAAAPAVSTISRFLRRGIVGVLFGLAFYFVLCLRLTYFKEYEYDKDVKDVYRVLAQLNHQYGVTRVLTNGLYSSPLNFYRVVSKQETFPAFIASTGMLRDKDVYVINDPYDAAFIKQEGLIEIYRGKSTGIVIAVRPDGPIPVRPLDDH
jgi:hypothetical protein